MQKIIIILILWITVMQGMEKPPVSRTSLTALRTNRVAAHREEMRATYYPDLIMPNEQEWAAVTRCFRALLKLDFYPSVLTQEPRITFADAKQYYDVGCMYESIFPAHFPPFYRVLITRWTNKVMCAAFYPDGPKGKYVIPAEGKEEQVITRAHEKVVREFWGQEDQEQGSILVFEDMIESVKDFKINPPKRDKIDE